MELARPNHPLLRDLVMKAPGTYHHSLLVSNMAEQAAEAIGADAFLTRVGAYYHDIGKINRPYFFVENRLQGIDPHSQLDPWSSAKIIINHVKDGRRDGQAPQTAPSRPRLHRRAPGHRHRARLLSAAQQAAGPEAGRRKGLSATRAQAAQPRDGAGHAGRQLRKRSARHAAGNAEQIDELVRKIINQKLIEGELSQSPLTLLDLETTRRIFVQSLQGAHHPRDRLPRGQATQNWTSHQTR